MANRSFRNTKTPGIGVITLPLSFASGANNADAFVDEMLEDGYIADAYGSGVRGVCRESTGAYQILLSDRYVKLISAEGSLSLKTNKDLCLQFRSPAMEDIVCTDGKTRSMVRLRICEAGVLTDLKHEDRVFITLFLDNSGTS